MVMSSPQKTGIELRWHDMKIFGFNSGKKLENCLVNLRSCCISLFRRFESDTFVYDIVFYINRFPIQGFGLNDLLVGEVLIISPADYKTSSLNNEHLCVITKVQKVLIVRKKLEKGETFFSSFGDVAQSTLIHLSIPSTGTAGLIE